LTQSKTKRKILVFCTHWLNILHAITWYYLQHASSISFNTDVQNKYSLQAKYM